MRIQIPFRWNIIREISDWILRLDRLQVAFKDSELQLEIILHVTDKTHLV
jgi:hypothetical protein